jgi:hypothetical protein
MNLAWHHVWKSIHGTKKYVMKKMLLVLGVIAFTALAHKPAAQVRLNVNINLGSQPAWGPSGYDYVDYYYLPDMDVYYYVPQRQFIYYDRGRWVHVTTLPPRYRSYDLYNSYKVVINEPRPYLRHNVYHSRYAKYKGWDRRQSVNRNYGKYKSYKDRGRKRGRD